MQYVLCSAPNLYFNLTFNGIASVHFKYCPKLFDHKINFHACCIVAWLGMCYSFVQNKKM